MKNVLPRELWMYLERLPAFRFMKQPVDNLYLLYEKYPDGCEKGAFVLVIEENAFYHWDFATKKWIVISGSANEQLADLSPSEYTDGDVVVWDEERQTLCVRSLSLWNEVEW